jgi:hypothetical protein
MSLRQVLAASVREFWIPAAAGTAIAIVLAFALHSVVFGLAIGLVFGLALGAVVTMASRELIRLGAAVVRLQNREAQLRALIRRDIELEHRRDALERAIADPSAAAHISRQIAEAVFETHPFPHLIVDHVLPQALYDALVTGLPPAEMFNEQLPNKGSLKVPFALAPAYTRRIWNHVVQDVVPTMLMPPLVDRFAPVIDAWVREQFPGAGIEAAALDMKSSNGRVLLRTRGYVIPPHRDPKWGFVTCILYLARRGDSERWGTQLYEVEGDGEARGAPPHWIDSSLQCRQVKDVTFVPNRMLTFLNSVGAHGATIPEDAPAGLERYIYQFRIGPNKASIVSLMTSLPDDRRALWAGKLTDY